LKFSNQTPTQMLLYDTFIVVRRLNQIYSRDAVHRRSRHYW